METKLTLKLDEAVIRSAKAYAKSKNESVSHLVEAFFRSIVTQQSQPPKISPLVEELSGVIPATQAEIEDYTDYLEKKYE